MKSTGVVRRVDDLGRIVIPKEIRRTLRIRDGEELEIFTDNDMIVLKKFSKVADLDSVSKKIIDVVSSLINKTILVLDRDHFITGSGEFKKNYMNKEISSKIEDIINNRSNVVEKEKTSIELIDGLKENYAYIINPIISFGDVVGAIVVLATDSINEFDITVSNLVAQFLGKYVED